MEKMTNKIQKTIDTQDAQWDAGFMNNAPAGVLSDAFQDPKMLLAKDFIQSSRTALIEEVIKMGKSKIDYLKRHKVMSEESKYDVIREINLFLAPLKEVIDKDHEEHI